MEKKYQGKWRLQWPECSINLCWEQEGASSNYQLANKPTCTPIPHLPSIYPTTSALSLNRKVYKLSITTKTALANVNNIQFLQSFALSDRSLWQSLNLGPITPYTRRKHLIILRLSSDVSYLLNEPIHLPPCLMSMERGGSSWVIRERGRCCQEGFERAMGLSKIMPLEGLPS